MLFPRSLPSAVAILGEEKIGVILRGALNAAQHVIADSSYWTLVNRRVEMEMKVLWNKKPSKWEQIAVSWIRCLCQNAPTTDGAVAKLVLQIKTHSKNKIASLDFLTSSLKLFHRFQVPAHEIISAALHSGLIARNKDIEGLQKFLHSIFLHSDSMRFVYPDHDQVVEEVTARLSALLPFDSMDVSLKKEGGEGKDQWTSEEKKHFLLQSKVFFECAKTIVRCSDERATSCYIRLLTIYRCLLISKVQGRALSFSQSTSVLKSAADIAHAEMLLRSVTDISYYNSYDSNLLSLPLLEMIYATLERETPHLDDLETCVKLMLASSILKGQKIASDYFSLGRISYSGERSFFDESSVLPHYFASSFARTINSLKLEALLPQISPLIQIFNSLSRDIIKSNVFIPLTSSSLSTHTSTPSPPSLASLSLDLPNLSPDHLIQSSELLENSTNVSLLANEALPPSETSEYSFPTKEAACVLTNELSPSEPSTPMHTISSSPPSSPSLSVSPLSQTVVSSDTLDSNCSVKSSSSLSDKRKKNEILMQLHSSEELSKAFKLYESQSKQLFSHLNIHLSLSYAYGQITRYLCGMKMSDDLLNVLYNLSCQNLFPLFRSSRSRLVRILLNNVDNISFHSLPRALLSMGYLRLPEHPQYKSFTQAVSERIQKQLRENPLDEQFEADNSTLHGSRIQENEECSEEAHNHTISPRERSIDISVVTAIVRLMSSMGEYSIPLLQACISSIVEDKAKNSMHYRRAGITFRVKRDVSVSQVIAILRYHALLFSYEMNIYEQRQLVLLDNPILDSDNNHNSYINLEERSKLDLSGLSKAEYEARVLYKLLSPGSDAYMNDIYSSTMNSFPPTQLQTQFAVLREFLLAHVDHAFDGAEEASLLITELFSIIMILKDIELFENVSPLFLDYIRCQESVDSNIIKLLQIFLEVCDRLSVTPPALITHYLGSSIG